MSDSNSIADQATISTSSVIKLTEYSHGSGCGCKIAPKLLEDILKSNITPVTNTNLLVGNDTRDDAAVYDLGNGTSLVSTTDFFMPIVDDPFEFGQIAATNAISDIYAMGGSPLLAISIFGWPIDKLSPEVANRVIHGGRYACELAGIPLAGGHSIDSPEPIFGLAVTGLVNNHQLKRNSQAQQNDKLYLTKPLGIGIFTTAQKKKLLKSDHIDVATKIMCQLNSAGEEFGKLNYVTAMTDVTGFGLLGHLLEMCEASNLNAEIEYRSIPKLPELESYIQLNCSPGGANRNFASYGHKISAITEIQQKILCDPQTSGGLLVAVRPDAESEFLSVCEKIGLTLCSIGQMYMKPAANAAVINVL